MGSRHSAAQCAADIRRGGSHLVVSASTSSGKTMLGELAALRHVLERRRALFLLPLKALIAGKKGHFEAGLRRLWSVHGRGKWRDRRHYAVWPLQAHLHSCMPVSVAPGRRS
jgi:hypothetical protein